MAVDSTFYDRNWTVLEKLKYIEQWCMENQLDVNSITFDVSTAQEVTTIVVKGMNYEGKEITMPAITFPSGGNKIYFGEGNNG